MSRPVKSTRVGLFEVFRSVGLGLTSVADGSADPRDTENFSKNGNTVLNGSVSK